MDDLILLLVDDEPEVLSALRRDVKRLGFSGEILLASGYEQALSHGKVDVVITDQRMPINDGMSLVKKVRELYPETICIMMSGYSDFDIVVNGLNEGKIAGFIVKPWTDDLLRALLSRAQEQYKQQSIVNYYKTMNLWDKNAWLDGIEKFSVIETSYNRKQILALSHLIKAKDEELFYHASRVARLCVDFAIFLNHPEEFYSALELAALAHDIGKIAIRDDIHYKPGKLDGDEYHQMKKHAEIGAELLSDMGVGSTIVAIVAQHHEHVDGTGYPSGLSGEAIVVPARMLSIVDAFDALTSDRVYRKGFSDQEALEILRNNVGKIYDEMLFNSFLEWRMVLR